jgi:hypothetical protein
VRLDGRVKWFFFLLPIPLIGFRRRLVEIGRLRTSTTSHHHRHRLDAFPLKPHDFRVVQRWKAFAGGMFMFVVGGGVAGQRRVAVALADEIWAGRNLISATVASQLCQCDGRAVRLCL